MKQSKTMFFNLCLFSTCLFFQSCASDDADPFTQIDLVTSQGNIITMTGNWLSPCVDLDGNSIQEVFTFNGTQATIDIDIFSGSGCQGSPTQNQVILLDITEVGGTYAVALDGSSVIANRVSGIESPQNQNRQDNFKQAFYVDDSGANPVMYHGIFGDDGGLVDSNGYPLQLHNIGIVKQ